MEEIFININGGIKNMYNLTNMFFTEKQCVQFNFVFT